MSAKDLGRHRPTPSATSLATKQHKPVSQSGKVPLRRSSPTGTDDQHGVYAGLRQSASQAGPTAYGSNSVHRQPSDNHRDGHASPESEFVNHEAGCNHTEFDFYEADHPMPGSSATSNAYYVGPPSVQLSGTYPVPRASSPVYPWQGGAPSQATGE